MRFVTNVKYKNKKHGKLFYRPAILEYYHGRLSETVFGLNLMSSNSCSYKTNTYP